MHKKKVRQNIFILVLKRAIPLWMIVILLLQSSAAVGLIEYYIMQKKFNETLTSLAKSVKNPEDLALILRQQVLPQGGYTLGVTWKDIGKQLLESGSIDKQKYEKLFAQEPESKNMMKYLDSYSKNHMIVNEKNARFMVNTLWALGLVNKSKVLDEGQMKTYGENPMNFASTGGWTLGSKPTSELYSSQQIIKLTSEQESLVQKIASNIYRPCCGNSTAFPDCNHGMAALGYIELAVKQGLPENKIYKDILALNSFWFPQQYVQLATYMKKQGTEWESVDAKLALSQQYSSARGSQQVQQAVQNIPGLQSQQGGCGA